MLANPRGLLWPLFRVRLSDFLSRLQFRLSSYSGTPLFSTPRWRAGSRRDIAQAGRDLHARMHGAVAAGDLAAIKSVCMPQLARTLSAAVAARPRGQRVEWEVLGYGTGGSGRGGTRLLDHKIAVLPLGPSPTDPRVVQRQAVVAVRSRQRLARYDAATGRLIPGSERVRELDEYLVLHRYVLRDDDGGDGRGLGGSGGKSKKKTPFKETPWKVFGTLSPTTADSWREAMALQETIMKQEAERKLAAPR